jgi:hypothetical protein
MDQCGECEARGKTTAGPSTPFAAPSAANFAQDDIFFDYGTTEVAPFRE